MASKIKQNGNIEPDAKVAHNHSEKTSAKRGPTDEEIRSRAYEIYLERCDLPGSELDDWLQAERELESAARFLDAAPGERSED